MSEFTLGQTPRRYAKFTPAAAKIIREVYPSGGVIGTLTALADGLPGHSSAVDSEMGGKWGAHSDGTRLNIEDSESFQDRWSLYDPTPSPLLSSLQAAHEAIGRAIAAAGGGK